MKRDAFTVNENPALRIFGSLKNRNYKIFISGQCLSLTGTLIQTTAQQWLVYYLTDSPFMLGLITFFQYGPMIFLALPSGVIIDRFNKRKLFLITQIAFFVQALLLTIVSCLPGMKYWQVAALALFYGVVQSFDLPIRQSYFVDLVGPSDLPNAIALNSAVTNLSKIIGPILAGVLISVINVSVCFTFKTLSLIPVIIGILRITADSMLYAHEPLTPKALLKESADSLRYIRKRPEVKKSLLFVLIFCLFSANSQVVIPVYANELLNKGANGYTMMLAIYGLGGTIAAMVTSVIRIKKDDYFVLAISTAAISFVGIISGFVSGVIPCVLAIGIMGFFYLTFLNISNTMIQFQTDNKYLGRMLSIYSMFLMGVSTIGNSFLGYLMEKFGGHTGFMFAGIFTLIMLSAYILFYYKK